jgi:hypothetical protein
MPTQDPQAFFPIASVTPHSADSNWNNPLDTMVAENTMSVRSALNHSTLGRYRSYQCMIERYGVRLLIVAPMALAILKGYLNHEVRRNEIAERSLRRRQAEHHSASAKGEYFT